MEIQSVHTRLLVRDYRACYRFYTQAMGLAPTWGDEESGYADFRAGENGFSLFGAAEMAAGIGQDGSAAERPARDTAALIFAVPDVDAAYRELLARGAAAQAAPEDHAGWGIRTAHVRDPDGNLIELNQPLAQG